MKHFTYCVIALLFGLGSWVDGFAQPANDNFCNAILLTVNAGFCGTGMTNGDNTAASVEASLNEPGISCGAGGEVFANNTVWYSFVPATSTVSVSTNFGGGTNNDTQVVVYEDNGTGAGCPTPDLSSLLEVGCGDDVDDVNFLTEISCIQVTVGNTYYIQVDGWNGTPGSFCVEVADALPPVLCDADPTYVLLTGLPNCAGGSGSVTPVAHCSSDPEIGSNINDDPPRIYIPFAALGADGPYLVAFSSGTGSFYTSTTGCSNPPNFQDPLELDGGFIAMLAVTQADIDNAPGGVTTIQFSSCGTVCSTLDFIWATIPEAGDVAFECPPPACDLFGEVSLGTTCTSLTEFVVDVTIGAGATGTAFTITNDQNAESLVANGPGTYSFTTPVIQGTNVMVTVTQNSPIEPGCFETETITAADCGCFGSEPSNNECANAIAIPLAADIAVCTPTLVDTECADQSPGGPSCSATWFDDDVWYSVDVPAGFSGDGINILSTFGAGAVPITNNGVAVYDVCGGVELGCYSGGSELFIDAALFTAPTTLILRTWSAGNTTADQGNFEICAHEVNCLILSATAGTQSACNPVDQTYTQDIIVSYSGNVTSGNLIVNGQIFPITSSPQTVSLTGLSADDANPAIDATVTFTVPMGCTMTFLGVFNAPSTCVPLTCNDGPFNFCYGNFANSLTVGEVCPANPGETVRIAFGSGLTEPGFDTLFVYSGAPGSGTGGTLISANLTGALSELVFESAPDECIILVMNSDDSASCGDATLDVITYDCFTDCNNSTCFFPDCQIALRPVNAFPETVSDLAWSGVSPAVTTGANNTFEVCVIFTYSGTTGEGGTFSHAGLSNEAGNIDVIECATGIVASSLYPVGPFGQDCANPLTPDPSDPDVYTGLTNGAEYVFCVTYNILTDFTNPDTDGTTEGTCSLYGIGLAFTPTECFADAGEFVNDHPMQMVCFGDAVNFASNGDWANPLGMTAGDQTPPSGVIFGLWDSAPPSGGFPTSDGNFLSVIGSEPAGSFGPPELLNATGGNQTVWVTTIAASDEINGFIGTMDCFDVNEVNAVSYILLNEITGDASFVCNVASTGFDVTINNLTGGLPGFNMSGSYTVSDNAGGPGGTVPLGGSYTILNVSPAATVTISVFDGTCSQDILVTVPDLTPPSLMANSPYCISDPADIMQLDQPSGDFGTFELTVFFDQFPEETGFQLLDNIGNVATQALPGSFTGLSNCPGVTFTLGPFNINDGPFDLIMIDDFGDGMTWNDGVCSTAGCGPGGFGLLDTGTGTDLITLGLFPGEDSDGDACDGIEVTDMPVAPQGVSDIDGDGDPDQTITFTGLILTPVTAAATYSGPGVIDNLDGSASFNPGVAGIGTHPVLITWTNPEGCNVSFTEMLTVEATSQPSGNGISTWSDLMGGGQAFPPVNPSAYLFDTGVLDNSCVLSPADGTVQGLIVEGSNKPTGILDLDLSKAPCTGALSFNNAPIFYTLRSDPVEDPADGPGDQMTITVVPIATGSFSQLNVALYGPLTPGSRMFPEVGASFLGCEQGNGTSPTVLTVNGIPPDQMYFIIVDTDGGTSRTGNFIIQGQGTALPLELISFSGNAEGPVNALTWETASENGTDFFAIERSTGTADNFEELGRVVAAGFSSSILAYEFEDTRPGLESYYRLRMTDLDGNTNFSDIIFIKRALTGFIFNGVFPNPTPGKISIGFESPTSKTLRLSVTDVLGRNMHHESFSPAPGTNIKTVNLDQFAPGIYFISLENGAERFMRKVVRE